MDKMDRYFRYIITKGQERRINNKLNYIIAALISAVIIMIFAIIQICISTSDLYNIIFVENYHDVSSNLSNTVLLVFLLALAIFVFSIMKATLQPYDKFSPNKKLFVCLYIGEKYLLKEQEKSKKNSFRKIKNFLILRSISMSISDIIDKNKTISIFYDSEIDIELYKIQSIFSDKLNRMVIDHKYSNQLLEFISLLKAICYAYMPQKNSLYSNEELIELKKEADKKHGILNTLTEEILDISFPESNITYNKKRFPFLWANSIKFEKLKNNLLMLIFAYFGDIRTLISETSGQHIGIIRTAYRKHPDTLPG